MRAYMSDRDGRRQAADLPRVEWLAWSAESEARAILAETEPPRRFTGEPDPYAYIVADWPGFRGSRCACALAEALAGFIGREC